MQAGDSVEAHGRGGVVARAEGGLGLDDHSRAALGVFLLHPRGKDKEFTGFHWGEVASPVGQPVLIRDELPAEVDGGKGSGQF